MLGAVAVERFPTRLDRVITQLTFNQKSARGLHFFTRDRAFLGLLDEVARFTHHFFKLVSDDLVERGHSFLGDTGLWTDFFANAEDVGLERLVVLVESLGLGFHLFRIR